jgi:hypothetical protein
MGTVTYYVTLAFRRSQEGGEIVACDPKEARSSDKAIRMAASLARTDEHWGAIAFSRTSGRPNTAANKSAAVSTCQKPEPAPDWA